MNRQKPVNKKNILNFNFNEGLYKGSIVKEKNRIIDTGPEFFKIAEENLINKINRNRLEKSNHQIYSKENLINYSETFNKFGANTQNIKTDNKKFIYTKTKSKNPYGRNNPEHDSNKDELVVRGNLQKILLNKPQNLAEKTKSYQELNNEFQIYKRNFLNSNNNFESNIMNTENDVPHNNIILDIQNCSYLDEEEKNVLGYYSVSKSNNKRNCYSECVSKLNSPKNIPKQNFMSRKTISSTINNNFQNKNIQTINEKPINLICN
jgi:hypothetical protein